ncbi:antA/AntB antirepressor family protein [Lonepinella sp. MS14435]|uniref:antA/AntB antirepressor family protein n=1 Tax=Lonepinella sp. MS14435 TaxID=3003618 RepID=UPI0036D92F27
MNDLTTLLPLHTNFNQGIKQQLINAHDLWLFLEIKTRFNDWITRNIKEYGFKQGKDLFYSNLSKKDLAQNQETRGRKQKNYLLTISTAKELTMTASNRQGKLARRYFIQCEERLAEIAPEIIKEYRSQWQIDRNAVKTPFKRLCNALERNRERLGKTTEKHHYTNESNMIVSIVLGMSVQHWKQAHSISGDIRDTLTAEQLAKLEYLEQADLVLLDMNISNFHHRKEKLAEMLATHFTE